MSVPKRAAQVRFDADVYPRVEKTAASLGMSMATYLRTLALADVERREEVRRHRTPTIIPSEIVEVPGE